MCKCDEQYQECLVERGCEHSHACVVFIVVLNGVAESPDVLLRQEEKGFSYTDLFTIGTAVENGEGLLDKEATSHNNLFDTFRVFLQF